MQRVVPQKRRSLTGEPPHDARVTAVVGRKRGAPGRCLRGVVVCLTGLPARRKEELHGLVEGLGGRYTRDLDTARTTHLIASNPHGAKYDSAVRSERVVIVSPEWLDACGREGRRVREDAFFLDGREGAKLDEGEEEVELPLAARAGEMLRTVPSSSLFQSCRFILVGFDSEHSGGKENERPGGDQLQGDATREDPEEVRMKLECAIRHGRGTVYSELNEQISHVVVNELCDPELRKAALSLSLNHPAGPVAVSPSWILSSLHQRSLQPSVLFQPRAPQPKKVKVHKKNVFETPMDSVKTRRNTSSLFRGALFTVIRLTPPEGTVNFDLKALEEMITSHGGLILSRKIVDALKKGSSRTTAEPEERRVCYVISLGGYIQNHTNFNPLLAEISTESLCRVVDATHLWVQTCVTDKLITLPSDHPLLFQPQTWHIRRLESEAKRRVRVAVTGFVGGERSGLVQLLLAIGARYTENMKKSNTHLICKEGRGQKFEKAVEWGLHVVSAEWLFHVVRYGFEGQEGQTDGCEDVFSLLENSKSDGLPSRKKRRVAPVRVGDVTPGGESCTLERLPAVHTAASKGSSLRVDSGAGMATVEKPEKQSQVSEHDERLRSALKHLEDQPVAESKSCGNAVPTKGRKRRRRALSSALSSSSSGTETKSNRGNDDDAVSRSNVEEGDTNECSLDEEEDDSDPMDPPLLRQRSLEARREEPEGLNESQVVWYAEPTQQH